MVLLLVSFNGQCYGFNVKCINNVIKPLFNRLHLEEGRTLAGLASEYQVSKAAISNWIKNYREECQNNEEVKADYDYMKENLRLRKQLAEMEKENRF